MTRERIGGTLAAFAVALLSSGCWWVGAPFYQPDPARPSPVAPGRYAAIDLDDDAKGSDGRGGGKGDAKPGIVTIGRAADGSITVTDDTLDAKTDRGLFAPLDPGLWVTQAVLPGGGGDTAVYGLATPAADGSWSILPVIDCKPNQAIALAAGATLQAKEQAKDEPFCVFPTRAALEQGLRAYAAAHRPLPAKLRWVPMKAGR